MSGIVGLYHRTGEPVALDEIQRLTATVVFRGPDGHDACVMGACAFGHTRFHTTVESAREQQPRSFDGAVWITADARIDARAELRGKLEAAGRQRVNEATDDELILHAYHVWGRACLQHLLGDFAFAIWDGRRQELFCARDHFGVKPFFYAQVKDEFVFSNTFESVRSHDSVSDRLDDLTIADFLLFRGNLRHDSTGLADIKRLPPAHWLLVSRDTFQIQRYWTATIGEEVWLKDEECVERFHELLGVAVADRLRTKSVAVMMTGGLDSTAIAAKARDVLREQGGGVDVAAFNIVYDRLIPDEERHYSDLAARHLGIPITHLAADDYELFDRFDEPELHGYEPHNDSQAASFNDLLRMMTPQYRVVLTGWDGDSLMREKPSYYYPVLWRERRFCRMLLDTWRYSYITGKIPRVGIPRYIKKKLGLIPLPESPMLPIWLNPDLVRELDLKARWDEYMRQPSDPTYSRRPCAQLGLIGQAAHWASLFEGLEASASLLPLEIRHPLLDLRLLEFLLALPAIPWCIEKRILRVAHQGVLPQEVLRRPKTNLNGHPEIERLQETPMDLRIAEPSSELARFVESAHIPDIQSKPEEFSIHSRPLALHHWLNCQQSVFIQQRGTIHESGISAR